MARNPIFAQRELKARKAAEAAKNAPPVPASAPAAPPPPPLPNTPSSGGGAAPSSAVVALEALPDEDLHEKAKLILEDYDEEWERVTLIQKLVASGVAG